MPDNAATGSKDNASWIKNVRYDIGIIHNGFDFTEIEKRLDTKRPEILRAELEIQCSAALIVAVLRINSVHQTLLGNMFAEFCPSMA